MSTTVVHVNEIHDIILSDRRVMIREPRNTNRDILFMQSSTTAWVCERCVLVGYPIILMATWEPVVWRTALHSWHSTMHIQMSSLKDSSPPMRLSFLASSLRTRDEGAIKAVVVFKQPTSREIQDNSIRWKANGFCVLRLSRNWVTKVPLQHGKVGSSTHRQITMVIARFAFQRYNFLHTPDLSLNDYTM